MNLTRAQASFLLEAAKPFGSDPFSYETFWLHPVGIVALIHLGLVEFDYGSECWRTTGAGHDLINERVPF